MHTRQKILIFIASRRGPLSPSSPAIVVVVAAAAAAAVVVVVLVAAAVLRWQPMPTNGGTKATTPMPHATRQDGRGGRGSAAMHARTTTSDGAYEAAPQNTTIKLQ